MAPNNVMASTEDVSLTVRKLTIVCPIDFTCSGFLNSVTNELADHPSKSSLGTIFTFLLPALTSFTHPIVGTGKWYLKTHAFI